MRRLRFTLTVGVILLRRLRLALRQYNLTLELLQLGLEFVQLAVRLLHDCRDVGERFAIGRNLPQLLRAGLYLQLLQRKKRKIRKYEKRASNWTNLFIAPCPS